MRSKSTIAILSFIAMAIVYVPLLAVAVFSVNGNNRGLTWIVSYTGTWIQNVGSGWLMASPTMSPLMVSLVQAASSLPVFLVILPAGALADMVDRRRFLLATQGWMVVASGAPLKTIRRPYSAFSVGRSMP